MRPLELSFTGLAVACFTAAASAQVCTTAPCLTFDEQSGNFLTNGYGSATAILSDYDGGGRRELAVTSPFSGRCQIVSGESGGGTPLTLATLTGAAPGSAVLSVGDLDGQPGDEIALSNPNAGAIGIWSLQASGTSFLAIPRYTIIGPATLGTAMVMVDTQNGRRLAAGVPGQDTVRLYNLSATGATLAQTLIPGGGRTGSFGWSLAAGPAPSSPGSTPLRSTLAVGAPSYTPSTNPTSPSEGFVAVFNMAQPLPGVGQNEPSSFLYRAQAREQLGTAVASVGFLPNPGNSPLSDFVALGRSQTPFTPSVVVAFHTPNNILFTTTPQYGAVTNLLSSASLAPEDGRLVEAGDVDGDGLGEVVLSLNSSVRMFSTKGGALTPIALASYAGATSATLSLSSGPDVSQKGATDVVVGARNAVGAGGLVEAIPLAAVTVLPNPTSSSFPLLGSQNRPFPGLLRLEVTSQANRTHFLFGTFGPPNPVLFQSPMTYSYLNGTPVALGTVFAATSGTHAFAPLGVPNGFNFEALVYQVLQLDPASNISVSNGLLARIGQF